VTFSFFTYSQRQTEKNYGGEKKKRKLRLIDIFFLKKKKKKKTKKKKIFFIKKKKKNQKPGFEHGHTKRKGEKKENTIEQKERRKRSEREELPLLWRSEEKKKKNNNKTGGKKTKRKKSHKRMVLKPRASGKEGMNGPLQIRSSPSIDCSERDPAQPDDNDNDTHNTLFDSAGRVLLCCFGKDLWGKKRHSNRHARGIAHERHLRSTSR